LSGTKGEKSSETFADKVGKMDRRYIYFLLVVLLAIPYIRPIGLPVPIPVYTRRAMEYIDALKPGDYVIFHVTQIAVWGELGPSHYALFTYLLEKGTKIIMWGGATDAGNAANVVIGYVKPEKMGKKYGVDYANFGYVPGGETAYASLARDIHATFKADFYGTPIGSIPMMTNVRDARDIDLVIGFDAGNVYSYYSRQWVAPYNTILIIVSTAIVEADLTPFYQAGSVKGYISGIGGGAAVELLTKHPGDALKGMDALSIAHVLWILFVIIGNVAYWSSRLKSKSR